MRQNCPAANNREAHAMSFFSSRHLYPAHLSTIKSRVDDALQKAGFDHLLVAAGIEKMRFLDDMPYPFKVSPQFKQWLPLVMNPHCWISYSPGKKPVLAYYQPDDYWHVPPSAPEGAWVEHFDIRVIDEPAKAVQHLPVERPAGHHRRGRRRLARLRAEQSEAGDRLPELSSRLQDAL